MGEVKFFVHADVDTDGDAGSTTIALWTFVPASLKATREKLDASAFNILFLIVNTSF